MVYIYEKLFFCSFIFSNTFVESTLCLELDDFCFSVSFSLTWFNCGLEVNFFRLSTLGFSTMISSY